MSHHGQYRFGSFALDPVAKVLFRDGQPVHVPRKAVETLQVLAESAGQVVTREEIMRAVWPDRVVEEANLAQNIAVIRRTLGAAKGSPGQAKAMAEMYRLLASTGGMPYETDMTITVSGEGPMAALMAKMSGMQMTSTVQSVDTTALDDALFAPPAGYKIVPKK